jgi:hypothetical protein
VRGGGPHRHGLGHAEGDRGRRPVELELDVVAVGGGDRALRAGIEARGLEVVQQVLGFVLQTEDSHRRADLTIGQRHPVDALADGDRVSVGAGRRIADGLAHVGLEARRHRVLELLGLLMHVVPRHPDDVGEEALNHPMAPDDALGMLAPEVRELDPASAAARDVAAALQPAEHLVHGRSREPHRPREVGARHRKACLEQPEQRLEIFLFGDCRVLCHGPFDPSDPGPFARVFPPRVRVETNLWCERKP